MARNTTIIRSNYLWDESAAIYEHSLKLWEGLQEELDYDILFSQRGVLNLAHSLPDVREGTRRVNANRLNGVDAEWLDPGRGQEARARSSTSPSDLRYPVMGATFQPRGGIAKHDYVAWGYARAAAALGVDLIQNCEVTGFDSRGAGPASDHARHHRAPGGSRCAPPGTPRSSAARLGFRLPLQSHPLQALVSELLEQVLDTVVMSNAVHVYVSQAHKGELVMGAGIDAYNGYGQRGSFHVIEQQMAAAVELFPIFARAHVLRTWAGIVDVVAGRLADRRRHPGRGRCTSTAAGGPAASRPPRAPAGSTPTRSPTGGRIHWPNRSRWNGSPPGALVDEHGAAAVAH